MKFAWSPARALLLGVALIVVANAVVLAGVAYNRSGEPESVLRLTERELDIQHWEWPANENSSIDLHLRWRVAQVESYDGEYSGYDHGMSWLEPPELRELGFDIDGDLESEEVVERIRRQPSRRAWVVLEFDGPAYRTSVERARQRLERATTLASVNAGDEEFEQRLQVARADLEREETSGARLFVVDVGRDEATLRARYPDRQRYTLLKGRLDVAVMGVSGQKYLLPLVVDLDVGAIRVPHTYRELVEPFVRNRQPYCCEPRYAATVNFGRRFEPWIATLELLK